jgi:hypothetical protein
MIRLWMFMFCRRSQVVVHGNSLVLDSLSFGLADLSTSKLELHLSWDQFLDLYNQGNCTR